MKVGIYNQTITYKAGGTESYTAFLAEITVIAEKHSEVYHCCYEPLLKEGA